MRNQRITQNNLRTFSLLGVMTIFLLAIGWLVAAATGNMIFIAVFGFISIINIAISYWNSASIALRSMNARLIEPGELRELQDMVYELSSAAGQPMPALYISPTRTPNAFATGRNPAHAAVCVTQGIVDLLDIRELRGVIGHELSHVYNRDILTSSVASAMASIITSIGLVLLENLVR